MKRFKSIKALVTDHVHRNAGKVDYEVLTEEVLAHFPGSRWKYSHWSYWRSRILHGEFREEFSEKERRNLASNMGRGGKARDPEVKKAGDRILRQVRKSIAEGAGDDHDLYFKLNRWVFSRLQQDEIRLKKPIKQALWKAGMQACQVCGKQFASLTGVDIHRKDATHTYSPENCVLVCRDCHQKMDD